MAPTESASMISEKDSRSFASQRTSVPFSTSSRHASLSVATSSRSSSHNPCGAPQREAMRSNEWNSLGQFGGFFVLSEIPRTFTLDLPGCGVSTSTVPGAPRFALCPRRYWAPGKYQPGIGSPQPQAHRRGDGAILPFPSGRSEITCRRAFASASPAAASLRFSRSVRRVSSIRLSTPPGHSVSLQSSLPT